MSASRHPMTMKKVVCDLPGTDAVTVRRDVAYTADGALTMDVYEPPGEAASRPAVVFVSGYPDPGFEAMLGCKLKDMEQYTSWARLVAASGMVGVTYANREPAGDLLALLRHLRGNAAALGIDAARVGLWAGSGNAPAALWALMEEPAACAVLCYGYTLDREGAADVAGAAARFGFANPAAGRHIDALPVLPLLVVRAGRDEMPGLNASIDAFVADALARNLPLSLVNHAAAPHAFDVLDDGEASRAVIRGILAFLRFHLGA